MSSEPTKQQPICVGIGEILWDLLPKGKVLGGAPGNVVGIANQLGLKGILVSSVGDDPLGHEILERIGQKGLDQSGLRVIKELPTGVVDVTVDAAGVPTFNIRQPAAWDDIVMDAERKRIAQSAALIVFGTLAQRDQRSQNGILEFLKAAPATCIKVLDVNLRPPFIMESVIRASLELADVLKLNETELPVLAKILGLSGDETAQLKQLQARFDLDVIAYTLGPKGSRMITATEDMSHPFVDAVVVDTVGAGDSFVAVVATGILLGLELSKIQELANRVAAFVCTQVGGTPTLPEELVSAFRESTAKRLV
jgi:fructokinase